MADMAPSMRDGQTAFTRTPFGPYSSAAALVIPMTPCFVVVLAHFLTKDEKASVRKAVGVLVGFLGAYVLMSPDLQGGVSMRGLGQIAGLVASLAHAVAGIYGKRFRALSPVVAATGTGASWAAQSYDVRADRTTLVELGCPAS